MSEYRFRLAGGGDEPALRELWRSGFDDTDEFIEYFERSVFPNVKVALAFLGAEPAAMAVALPSCLASDGERRPAACIYGVTTAPPHRRRGVAAGLLAYLCEQCTGGYAGVIVSPDGAELFDYYAKTIGAETCFSVRTVRLEAGGLTARHPVLPVPAEAGAYREERERILTGRTHVDWGENAARFQKEICLQCGGDLFLFPGVGCAALERDDEGVLTACELLAPEDRLTDCAAGLLSARPSSNITLRLPVWSGTALGGIVEPFGMYAWLERGHDPLKKDGYLGFDFC